ncbi:acetylcholinesterase-like [Amblyomma americanum]
MVMTTETGALLSTLIISVASASGVIVTIPQGQLLGRSGSFHEYPINIFLGIPYANPPVGNLRFLKPEPRDPWEGLYNATAPKSSCMQPRAGSIFPIPGSFSEDCLYLNVYTPSISDSKRRPVLVWFFGGIYSIGSPYEEEYNATVLAAFNDLVVVTIDFRNSVFGFMDAHDPGGPGNVGLWDQRLVLEWIRSNIAMFGGDANSVTLFGSSSGSMLIHAHVLSPLSAGLFHRVYLMSGTLNTDTEADSIYESNAKGNEVAQILGCADSFQDLTTHTARVLDCLRNTTALILQAATLLATLPKFLFFMPTFKTEFMPLLPSEASSKGAFSPVDAVVSVTSNEGTFPFLYQPDQRLLEPDLEDVTIEYLQMALETLFNLWMKDKVVTLGLQYLKTAPPDDKVALRSTACDFFGKQDTYCPSRFFAESHSRRGRVYGQIFAHRSEMATTPEWIGVTHMDDVPYTFGIPFLEEGNYTDQDREFSLKIMKSLATFAETGTPAFYEIPIWPQFSLDNPSFVWLQPGNYGVVDDFFGTGCEMWRNFL